MLSVVARVSKGRASPPDEPLPARARSARRGRLALPLAALLITTAFAAPSTPPFVFTGPERAESTADGGLRPVVGVQSIQIYRANRTHPANVDQLGHTYFHQPMLAWWRGKFYVEFLSNPVGEHQGAGSTWLTSSADGVTWDTPRVIFPPFALPDGTQTLAHQRMGFYVAPDGRLLALAFYGKPPEPNDGTGIGRAVREVHEDGTLGPIYFIRLNAKQAFAAFTPPYPLYTASPDRGFVAACDALLGNKLMTAQWWEEDQLDESGFYTVRGKALSFVHRPDGAVLGVWKNALVALTRDEGRTWTEKQFGTNLPNNASKYALTRTGDGRFALFLNPTNRLRFPLAVITSDDCEHFAQLLAVHSETPDQRFAGNFKNLGPQYVRTIAEGNGTPPDHARATWVTYSVNKEDIWIARVPTPIVGATTAPVRDDFEADAVGAPPPAWNIYSPLWAPVRVVSAGGGSSGAFASPGETLTRSATSQHPSSGHALELRDEDPCDYARAVRVFPETHGLKAEFRVLARQTNARLEIELTDAHGNRQLLLALGEDGRVWVSHEGVWTDNGAYRADEWLTFAYDASPKPTSDRGDLSINGQPATPRAIGPTEATRTVERLSFRTGPARTRPFGGRDLPGADEKAPAVSFLIDDVTLTPVPSP
ncbi:MAG: exo-alpha-sialidase [Opitutae bacterium]|nr:exo-alpha-sialidase [Opitutae bacterium]